VTVLKITEQQLFDYIECPAKYDMKYTKGIDLQEPISLSRLLNKVAKYFYINLLNGKVCSINDLKNKWDSICKANPDYVDPKKNLAGVGMIVNMVNWASRNKITVLDVDTKYTIVIDGDEIEGNMDPILAGPGGRFELLSTNFSSKVPTKQNVDMRLKHTLDWVGFKAVQNKELSGIRVHSIKTDQDIFSMRGEPDYKRLNSSLRGIFTGIKTGSIYVRESVFCETCNAREYCKFWYR
jgi:hypothetical protein